MIALDVAEYLQTRSAGTPFDGFRISANNTPDTVEDSVSITDTGGYSPDRYHGETLPTDRLTAQIIVRSKQPSAAYLAAIAIYHALDEMYGETLNSHEYISVESTSPPMSLGQVNVSTHGQAWAYTLNIYAQIRRT